MNKFLKCKIKCLYILVFGFLVVSLTRLYHYELLSNILFVLTFILVLFEMIYIGIYIYLNLKKAI
jgi:hypothetical protein